MKNSLNLKLEPQDPSPRSAFATREDRIGNSALDALNFFISDMRDGVGPYLALFLVGRTGWSSSSIGVALACASLATLVSTAPIGWMMDASRRNKIWIFAACLLIAVATYTLTVANGFWLVVGLQCLVGVACAAVGPGIASLSLALSGRERLPTRIARNEIANHAGNFTAAAVAAYLAQKYSLNFVFYFVIAASIASAVLVYFVPSTRLQTSRAQEIVAALAASSQFSRAHLQKFFADPKFLVLIAITGLFQFLNAAMLPIEAQGVSHLSRSLGVQFLSNGIIVAQLTAVAAAWFAGSFTKRFSYLNCLTLGLAAVGLRALIFASFDDVRILTAAQFFDGVAGGIIAVAPIVGLSRLAAAREHFSFGAGLLATAIGMGASLSNFASGAFVEWAGAPLYFTVIGAFSFALALLTFTLANQSPLAQVPVGLSTEPDLSAIL